MHMLRSILMEDHTDYYCNLFVLLFGNKRPKGPAGSLAIVGIVQNIVYNTAAVACY